MQGVTEQVQDCSKRCEQLLEEAEALGVRQPAHEASQVNSKCAELERAIRKVINDEIGLKSRMQVHDRDQYKIINGLRKKIADKKKEIEFKDK